MSWPCIYTRAFTVINLFARATASLYPVYILPVANEFGVNVRRIGSPSLSLSLSVRNDMLIPCAHSCKATHTHVPTMTHKRSDISNYSKTGRHGTVALFVRERKRARR